MWISSFEPLLSIFANGPAKKCVCVARRQSRSKKIKKKRRVRADKLLVVFARLAYQVTRQKP
jgi:hypothetical protein